MCIHILTSSQAFSLILEQLSPSIYREDEFITDFLQINDAALTFADYMGLDNYFRRQAARTAGLAQATIKLVRGAMDLIFGFLPTELKAWLDNALAKDSMLVNLPKSQYYLLILLMVREIFGVIVSIERFLGDADERGNQFLLNLLGKQHIRLKGIFDRHIVCTFHQSLGNEN